MVTLKEIAKAVGVSTATVSRVLNFDPALSITEAKRQAIIETAEALNYATPRARNRARQHGLRKVALVHFLTPDLELIDPYYVGLRLGIESRCQALQCETVKLYHTDSMPEPTLLQSADGVIAIGLHSEAEVDWLGRYSRRLVFADFIPENDEFDAVASDLPLATRKLLTGLTEIRLLPDRLCRLDGGEQRRSAGRDPLPQLHRVEQDPRRVRSRDLPDAGQRRAQHRADRLSARHCSSSSSGAARRHRHLQRQHRHRRLSRGRANWGCASPTTSPWRASTTFRPRSFSLHT